MSLGTMEQRTEGMKKQAQELIEQAYNRGFKAGQENALVVNSDKFIEQGRNEAWEAARKIWLPIKDGGLFDEEIREIFGVGLFATILKEFSASEAVEKLRVYEEQEKQEEDDKIDVDKEKVMKLADEIGIHKLLAIVKEIRGE